MTSYRQWVPGCYRG